MHIMGVQLPAACRAVPQHLAAFIRSARVGVLIMKQRLKQRCDAVHIMGVQLPPACRVVPQHLAAFIRSARVGVLIMKQRLG